MSALRKKGLVGRKTGVPRIHHTNTTSGKPVDRILAAQEESASRMALHRTLSEEERLRYKALLWDPEAWTSISEVQQVMHLTIDGRQIKLFHESRYATGKKHELYTPERKPNPDGFTVQFQFDVIGRDGKMIDPKKILVENPVSEDAVARYMKNYGLTAREDK